MNCLARLEELIQELEASPDDEAKACTYRALQVFLDVQRDAFSRVIDILRREGHAGVIERLVADPLLGSMLRGYRLVEPGLEDTVREAIEALELGDRVRLVGVQSGVARLEMTADPETWARGKGEIETAVRAAAPGLVGVAIARSQTAALPVLDSVPAREWLPLVHWWSLEQEGRERVPLFDSEVLVCAVEGRAYAFDNRCPKGNEPLDTGLVDGFVFTCPAHGLTFDLRTGRCMENAGVSLSLRATRIEDGIVKIEAPHVQ